MKTFITGLLIIFSLTFTTQTQAKTTSHETHHYFNIDCIDIGIMQITEVTAFKNGNNQDNQRLNLYDETSYRYLSSIATSRYSENIKVDQGAYRSTNDHKEQSSYSKFAKSWQQNTSNLRMRRIEGSGKSLQRDHYQTAVNYRATESNANLNSKGNPQITKTILIHRNWSGSFNGRSSRDETSKTKVFALALKSNSFRMVIQSS